ncbi:MAG TPA: type III pantothenate kinase [Flavobacterium sp.]|jgi:type III pantothenate kinase
MLLAIDIGNTRIKAAVFEKTSLLKHFAFDAADAEKGFRSILDSYPNISDVIQSSVTNGDVLSLIPEHIKIHEIDRSWKFPFVNDYETPHTLGLDRMVLTAGAVLQYPQVNRLIIDAGTCITYDFVDSDAVYSGGAISPGIGLRYSSLHNYTARLPLLSRAAPTDIIGSSTADSIHSGVVNGVAFEIDGFISRYAENYANFIIILTGGDTVFLADRLKNTIFANSNFLLESLNHLFQYKIKND